MRSPIEKSDPHLRLLGIIAARWATLDLTLANLVGKGIGNRQMGEDIYFSISGQRLRFDLLRAIVPNADCWDDVDKKALGAAIDALDGLWRRRNAILHSPAIASPSRKTAALNYHARSVRPANKVRITNIPLSVKELSEHAEAVYDQGGAIWDIINREDIQLLGRLGPSREK